MDVVRLGEVAVSESPIKALSAWSYKHPKSKKILETSVRERCSEIEFMSLFAVDV